MNKDKEFKGVFDCPYCRACFPTHYYVTSTDRWVSGASNFIRHRDKCKRDAEILADALLAETLKGYKPLTLIQRILATLHQWSNVLKIALSNIQISW